MSKQTKLYEALIESVISDNHDKATQIFHQIVVSESKRIFESLVSEDMPMGGQVGDLMNEIDGEDDEDYEAHGNFDIDDDGHDESGEFDIDGDDEADDVDFATDEGEDTLVRIESKLDELLAEFGELNGEDESEDDDFGDMGGDDDGDFGSDEETDYETDGEDDEEFADDEEDGEDETVMEAIQLKRVTMPSHGDNGANSKSPTAFDSGKNGMASKPVNWDNGREEMPKGPKRPTNPYTKGEKEVKGAGSFKNVPGKDNFRTKGETAPKAKSGDDGANKKSPLGESRRQVDEMLLLVPGITVRHYVTTAPNNPKTIEAIKIIGIDQFKRMLSLTKNKDKFDKGDKAFIRNAEALLKSGKLAGDSLGESRRPRNAQINRRSVPARKSR